MPIDYGNEIDELSVKVKALAAITKPGETISRRLILPAPTKVLDPTIRGYVSYAAALLGKQDPGTIPDVIIADKIYVNYVAGVNYDADVFGMWAGATKDNFLLLRSDVVAADDPIRTSVIVHETTHYVDRRDDGPICRSDPDAQQRARDAEKRAYRVQAQWLWDQGINPRRFPAMSYENLVDQTGDPLFSSLHWLAGYTDDENGIWTSYWEALHSLNLDLLNPGPGYSLEDFKAKKFKANPIDPLQALLASLLRGGGPQGDDYQFGGDYDDHCKTTIGDDLDAILIIEGGTQCADEYIAAFQHLVNNGMAWKLQGFYGRTAKDLIARGEVIDPNA